VVDLPQRSFADDNTGHSSVPFHEVDARLSTIAQVISVELATGGAADPLIAEGLGAYLNAALVARPLSAPMGTRLSASQQRIARAARAYVDAHLTDEITISEIAVSVGASVAHLQRCFRACFDLSIVRYIHQARLRRATSLLQTTDLTVIEVAFAVGFADASYFARLFRREYGIAPARFRRAD
jgi:AraC-like DNA-binding protein